VGLGEGGEGAQVGGGVSQHGFHTGELAQLGGDGVQLVGHGGACFLLSDLARAVTGEIIHADDGHHAMAWAAGRTPRRATVDGALRSRTRTIASASRIAVGTVLDGFE
jgi:hypothetical protein